MAAQISYSAHARALLKIGLPIAGGNLAQIAMSATDTLMLGWYSISALAAVTLASSLLFSTIIVGAGFAWAVTPLVAEAAARGDETQIRRYTRMGLWLSVLFSICVLPVMWFSQPLLIWIGQTPDIAQIGQDYLRIAGLGMIPSVLVFVMRAYLAALERTQVILWVTVVAAVMNAGLNYVLIFGNFGAPEMGVRGAAVASVTMSVFSLIVLLIYARRSFPQHNLLQRLWRPDLPALLRVLKLGWPIGLTNFAETGLFTISAIMMGWLGEQPLAAHGIVLQVAAAVFVIHLGLSQASTVRAGQAVGTQDVPGLRRGAITAIIVSLLLAILTALVFIAVPRPIVAAFLDASDPQRDAIVQLGQQLLILAGAFQVADAAQVMALGLLRGVQDTRVPMILAIIGYWGLGLGSCYVLGFTLGWGGVGIWSGLVVGLFAAACMMMLRFWKRSVHIA